MLPLCSLVSCGQRIPPVKTERQMQEDLRENVAFLGSDMSITSLEIIKRQTNENELLDTVYVEVQCTGSYYESVTSYVMHYSLYDQGWILDDASRWYDGRWYATPSGGVPEDTIKKNVLPDSSRYYKSEQWEANLIEITKQDVNVAQGTATVYYRYSISPKQDGYGYYLVDGYMSYDFDSQLFCYYPNGEFGDVEVRLIPYESTLGKTFNYNHSFGYCSCGGAVHGKFNIVIDSLAAGALVAIGHGSCKEMRIGNSNIYDYYEDFNFEFIGWIETFKRSTTMGYDYWANVRMGDICPHNVISHDGISINYWFSFDAQEGIGYVTGDLQ